MLTTTTTMLNLLQDVYTTWLLLNNIESRYSADDLLFDSGAGKINLSIEQITWLENF